MLHKSMSSWIRSSITKVEDFLPHIPNLVHHLMMSQQEDRASALQRVVQRLSQSNVLTHASLEQVRWCLPESVLESGTGNSTVMLRVEQALLAFPYLRGFAKAIQQDRIGEGVRNAVRRF